MGSRTKSHVPVCFCGKHATTKSENARLCGEQQNDVRKNKTWVLARSPHKLSFNLRHTADHTAEKGERSHGELLLNYGTDMAGFLLVAMLGFLPLFIVHWADRRPQEEPWPRRTWHILGTLKALLVVEWADWLSALRLW